MGDEQKSTSRLNANRTDVKEPAKQGHSAIGASAAHIVGRKQFWKQRKACCCLEHLLDELVDLLPSVASLAALVVV